MGTKAPIKNGHLISYKLSRGEIIGVKVCNRQTDRQTNSLTPYTGACGFFLSVKFATFLTRFARRGIKIIFFGMFFYQLMFRGAAPKL